MRDAGTPPTDLFIDGAWRAAADTARFEVHEPATGAVLATVADASVDDGLAALAAAHTAQPGWAAQAPRRRSDLHRICRRSLLRTEITTAFPTSWMLAPTTSIRRRRQWRPR